jgi:hypothetical protein
VGCTWNAFTPNYSDTRVLWFLLLLNSLIVWLRAPLCILPRNALSLACLLTVRFSCEAAELELPVLSGLRKAADARSHTFSDELLLAKLKNNALSNTKAFPWSNRNILIDVLFVEKRFHK